jgi:hypothetical protein
MKQDINLRSPFKLIMDSIHDKNIKYREGENDISDWWMAEIYKHGLSCLYIYELK